MNSGRMRDRVSFFRRNTTPDEYGNISSGFESSSFLSRWCEVMPERGFEQGRERMRAGRPESSGFVMIRLRRDSKIAAVTAADKAVIRGEDYQIRHIEPHLNDGARHMLLERGVAIANVAPLTGASPSDFSSDFSSDFA